jgi:hypothetical protein
LVKPADRRSAKYNAKFDAGVIALRWPAVKSDAQSAFGVHAAALTQMEETVKNYLSGVSPAVAATDIPAYLAFARQIYKLTSKYIGTTTSSTLGIEVATKGHAWRLRGKSATVLAGIATLFGVTVGTGCF